MKMNKDLIIQNRQREYYINKNSAKPLKEVNSEEYAIALLPYALYAARFAVYEPSHIE